MINATTGTCARYKLSAGKDGGLGLPGRALKVNRTLVVREGEAHFGQRQHRLRRRPVSRSSSSILLECVWLELNVEGDGCVAV